MGNNPTAYLIREFGRFKKYARIVIICKKRIVAEIYPDITRII